MASPPMSSSSHVSSCSAGPLPSARPSISPPRKRHRFLYSLAMVSTAAGRAIFGSPPASTARGSKSRGKGLGAVMHSMSTCRTSRAKGRDCQKNAKGGRPASSDTENVRQREVGDRVRHGKSLLLPAPNNQHAALVQNRVVPVTWHRHCDGRQLPGPGVHVIDVYALKHLPFNQPWQLPHLLIRFPSKH